jgi:hypothetical protein
MKTYYLLMVLVFSILACKTDNETISIPYTKVAQEKCDIEPANVYHYILPEQHEGSLSLVIILDSGGDGLLAVKKAEPAVFEIPCMVVGSDLIRNNFAGYEPAIERLIEDVCRKFPVAKEQVFIAGFSGGARMAFEYARKHRIKGVLMCGAGPSPEAIRQLPCPLYMITGTTDFNFSEMYYNPLEKPVNAKYLTDFFRGKHEWPPADILQEGFLYLMGHNIENGERLLQQESEILVKKADSLLTGNETLFALKALEKALTFDPGNNLAKKRMQKIKSNQKYSASIIKIEKDLALEYRVNQAYFQASLEQDSVWWAKEIKQLTLEIDKNTENRSLSWHIILFTA